MPGTLPTPLRGEAWGGGLALRMKNKVPDEHTAQGHHGTHPPSGGVRAL